MVCLVDYQKWLKDGGNTLKKTKKTVLTLGSTSYRSTINPETCEAREDCSESYEIVLDEKNLSKLAKAVKEVLEV